MKIIKISISTCLLITQWIVPVHLQSIQSRRYEPIPDKCDRYGRCSAKEGYIEEAVDDYKSDKERPAVLTRDDWPSRPQPEVIKEDLPGGGRSTSGGYGGAYNPKPVVDRDDVKPSSGRPSSGGYDPKPTLSRDDDLKPNVRPSSGSSGYVPKPPIDRDDDIKLRPSGSDGVGYGGGYNPKPPVDRDDDLKPVRSSSGGGYNSKPLIDRDDDLKPVRPSSGGGYNSKPPIDREDDLKPARPSSGGGYNPKPPIDRDDDLKPARPSSGGGYNPKPFIDREDELRLARPSGGGGYGGGYNPKPIDRDENKPVRGRPSGGYDDEYNAKPVLISGEGLKISGGRPSSGSYGSDYNSKPVVDRGDYDTKADIGRDPKRPSRPSGGYDTKRDHDDYDIKPAGGGARYYHDNERKTYREDLGGYNKPKNDEYGDDVKDDDDFKDDDEFDGDSKPVSVVDGNCICVPYYNCEDGHIVTDGRGIIDARKRPEPFDELPLDGKLKLSSCGPIHVCCSTPESSTVKPYEHRCGVRNPSGINSRILSPSNKGEADFGEWPWQAAVLKAEGKVNIFQCGGVLIDKYHIVTVAHCVFHLYQFNEYPLKVRLGEWDTQTTTEFLAHEDYRVSKIIVHPEYRNSSLWNDIAVLRLQDPVLFAPHIDTVCLPQYDEVFDGQNCVVTGWGKDAYKGGTFSNVMKEVALQVIDSYKCEEMLRKTRLGRFFELHQGFLCAGGEYGLDSCKGDGGGPLVCYRKDKSYALAGIVSWGIDCGQPGVPGVYVKIQKYLDWISKTTGVTLQDYWPKT